MPDVVARLYCPAELFEFHTRMHGTLAYMPVAMRKVMPYLTRASAMFAMAAYPAIAMGSVNSMITPRSLRRSERKATTTGEISAVSWPPGGIVLTGQDCGDGVRDHSPQLDLVGVGCEPALFDDGRQLWMLVAQGWGRCCERRTNRPNE